MSDRRWTAFRKADVVRDVQAGHLTFADACMRYALSPEELESWIRREHRFGHVGLKATRVQGIRANEQRAEVRV